MPTSIIEATKIQARTVIPIVKALEAELGKEKAHEIVGRAIASNHLAWMEKRGAEPTAHPRDRGESPSFPVESEVIDDGEDSYGCNFTSCAFADFFCSIGEPEIGALMTCGVDFATEDHLRPGWEFTRTQTRMQGADFCDFRWKRKS
jgi:L-2-amino-thiazoline-4-carboxylic acid hydrolase